MTVWNKRLLISISIIYFFCLADFMSRSEEDLLNPIETCGLVTQVEYNNKTRRSELSVMIFLKVDNALQPTKIKFRNDKSPIKTYETLKHIPSNEVCISMVSSPLFNFLKYPIQVKSQDGELYFQASMSSTYFDKQPYIFWSFMLPISFVLAKLLNNWALRKRANA